MAHSAPRLAVDGVVPADVLSDGKQLAGRGEQASGVQPSRFGEDHLAGAQPVRQRAQDLWFDGGPSGNRSAAADAQGLEALLAADPAGARRREPPVERGERRDRPGERHRNDVARSSSVRWESVQ